MLLIAAAACYNTAVKLCFFSGNYGTVAENWYFSAYGLA